VSSAALLAFFALAIAVIVTPGQDTALTIRNTLRGGRRAGVQTAFGVFSGQLLWTLAASAGIATLVVAFEPAFTALKLAGAAYLVYLGLRSLLDAVRHHSETAIEPPPPVSGRSAYQQGLISNLSNPKMAVFFTSLLPQFVSAGQASFWRLLPLGVALAAMTLVWLAAYAFVVARAGDYLRRSAVRRLLDAATGSVMVGLGLRLATAER
jgi:threonine/homoserine/homoserine lactone efflux protein